MLKGVDLTLERGQTTAIIGPSGAGKSTLLHLVGLLERPSAGRLLFDGQATDTMNERLCARFRLEKIGFIFQFHHLLPEFTALENAMMPGLIAGIPHNIAQDRSRDLLSRVGLAERLQHKPGELSGGEQQRVALARSLMNEPILILADEPTGNLDREASGMLRELLWGICRDRGAALLLVSHNQVLAEGSDRILKMHDGRLELVTNIA